MTTPGETPAGGALDALQRLETALEERDESRAAADIRLAASHAASERILARARAAGEEAGRARRDELIAEAEAASAVIRAAGVADADRLMERMSNERGTLVAELTGLLFDEEV